jgi:hypothetical protein
MANGVASVAAATDQDFMMRRPTDRLFFMENVWQWKI